MGFLFFNKDRLMRLTFFNILLVIIVFYIIKGFYRYYPMASLNIENVQYRFLVLDEKISYRLNLVIKNLSSESKTFTSSTGRFFEMEAYRDNKRIWIWSKDKFFFTKDLAFTLKPQEKKEFNVRWNKFDYEDNPVQPGEEVTVICRLITLEAEPALSVKFKVKGIGK